MSNQPGTSEQYQESHDGLEKQPAASKPPGEEDHSAKTSRRWQAGRVRFPWIAAIALALVLALSAGIFTLIYISDGQDYETWSTWFTPTLTMNKGKIHKSWSHKVSVPVSVWISIFVFIAGKLLALAFVDALTVYWWSRAITGSTLRELNFNYEAGRSLAEIIRNWRMFNWLCVCSIAFTLFGISGPILQKSSTLIPSATTGLGIAYDPKNMTSLQADLGTTFPAGASAEYDDDGNFLALKPLSTMAEKFVTQTGVKSSYTMLRVLGCLPVTKYTTESVCYATMPILGFNYTCEPEVWVNSTDGGDQTLFSVRFDYDAAVDPWKIGLTTTFKNDSSCKPGNTILMRRCMLVPALVHAQTTFSMIRPNWYSTTDQTQNVHAIADLDLYMDWRQQLKDFKEPYDALGAMTADGYVNHNFDTSPTVAKASLTEISPMLPGRALELPLAVIGEGPSTFYIDKPVEDLTKTWPTVSNATKSKRGDNATSLDDPASTIGGIVEIFKNILESSVVLKSGQQGFEYNGSFWGSFANASETASCSNVFADPMQEIVGAVRSIMFTYTWLIPLIHANDPSGSDVFNSWNNSASYNAKQNSVNGGRLWTQYSHTKTVYYTDAILLAVAFVIMFLSICATASLFMGYRKIGRSMTLSPLEIARALQLQEFGEFPGGIRPQEASNVRVDDWINLLGDVKVKYGEVSNGRLGMGPMDRVAEPRNGFAYF